MTAHEFTSSCSCQPNFQFLSYICFSFMTSDQSTVRTRVFKPPSSLNPHCCVCSWKLGGESTNLSEWELHFSITAATAGKLAFVEVTLAHSLGEEKLFLIKMEAKQFRQLERLLKMGKTGFPGGGQWNRENLSLWRADRRIASGEFKNWIWGALT